MSDPVTERHPDIPSLERLLFLEFDKHERMQALFEVAELFERLPRHRPWKLWKQACLQECRLPACDLSKGSRHESDAIDNVGCKAALLALSSVRLWWPDARGPG